MWEQDPFDDFQSAGAGPETNLHSGRNSVRARVSRLPDPPQWEQDVAYGADPVPRRRTRQKPNAQEEMKYLPPPRTRSQPELVPSYLTKLGPWPKRIGVVILSLMSVQLVFSDGGLLDYHSKQKILSARQSEFDELKAENSQIKEEIFKIRNLPRVQKELARTHLGLISADEHLVMFAGEEHSPSNGADRQH